MKRSCRGGPDVRWARAVACLAAVGLVLAARSARAFTIATLVTKGCHEKLTTDALREVRAILSTAAPLPATGEDRALIEDLPFAPAPDMRDLGGATLLVGVRDNDLNGLSGNDLSRLAFLHGNPSLQQRHCLHDADAPEPDGSPAALYDCRVFILERVDEALDGLDATGTPDPAARTSLPVYLALRHGVNVSLPTYYIRIGQAVHALEDSFAHSYRTPDGTQVTAVVNWVNEVENNLNEAVDGPPHSTEMDRCDDPDELRLSRRLLATQAATSMLQLTLDPTQTHAQKMAGAAALLDAVFSYSPGCTAASSWCGAPERKLEIYRVLGCDIGAPGRAGWGSVIGLALLAFLARGRRRAVTVVVLVLALSGRARAETPASADVSGAAATAYVPAVLTMPVPETGPADKSQLAVGAYLGVSGSVNDAALAATLGARLRVSRHWSFGLDGEWNPWLSVDAVTHFRAGAVNLYGSGFFRIPLEYEPFNLRIGASIGGSRTLIDLYGVPKGTTGLYLGLSPLAVEWKATRNFYVVINPLSFAMPMPQLGAVPFWYPQYRASIGLELYGGGASTVGKPRFVSPETAEMTGETAGGGDVATKLVPRSGYRLSFNLDAPLILIGGGVSSSYLFIKETAPPACAPLCDRNQVNAFDRPFAGLYSHSWQTFGNYATATTILFVPVGLIIAEPSLGGLGDLLIVGEAALLTSAIQVTSSYAVARPRPRVYGETAPLDLRDNSDAGRSFFSGHVANALAVTMVSTTALLRTHHRRMAWAVLAVGLTGSALIGIARVASGAHFPSDVLIGYAVGAGVGIAVPALHAVNLEVVPLADTQSGGAAIVGRF